MLERRRVLHERVARVLEAQFPETVETQPELIAHHYTEAGLGAQAIPYWQRAGERALQRWANLEAINHLKKGLELLDSSIDASERNRPANAAQRCSLLLVLGEAQSEAGEFLEARDTLLFAAAIAQSLGLTESVVRAALELVHITYQVGLPLPEAVRLLEEALQRLGPDDSPLKARALGGLARYLGVDRASGKNSKVYAPQAVAMARRLGDPELIGFSLLGMFYTLIAPEHAEQRLAIATEMLEHTKAADANRTRGERCLSGGGIACSNWEIRRRPTQNSSAGGAPWKRRSNLCISPLLPSCRSMRAFMRGRFEDSERLAQQAFAIGQQLQTETAAGVFGLQMFALRREQGRLKEVEPIVRIFLQQQFCGGSLASWFSGDLRRARTKGGRARGIRKPGAARLRRPAP